MTPRAVKLLIFTGCAVVALLVAVGAASLLVDYIQYRKVEITSTLLRDGKYDPSLHFKFDRACVFPPESALTYTLLTERGYREVDKIFPDTFTNWTLVLVDDNKKTFRTLYVLEPSVKFGGGITCNSKVTLETSNVNGQIVAHVKE